MSVATVRDRPGDQTGAEAHDCLVAGADHGSVKDRMHMLVATSSSISPADLAEEMISQLDDREMREMALNGLRAIARNVIVSVRGTGTHGRVSGASKWEQVAETVEAHPDIFRHRICVNANEGEWRFLGDCTAEDLDNATQIKRVNAAGLLREIKRIERLRAELSPIQRVRDLGRDAVRELWNA